MNRINLFKGIVDGLGLIKQKKFQLVLLYMVYTLGNQLLATFVFRPMVSHQISQLVTDVISKSTITLTLLGATLPMILIYLMLQVLFITLMVALYKDSWSSFKLNRYLQDSLSSLEAYGMVGVMILPIVLGMIYIEVGGLLTKLFLACLLLMFAIHFLFVVQGIVYCDKRPFSAIKDSAIFVKDHFTAIVLLLIALVVIEFFMTNYLMVILMGNDLLFLLGYSVYRFISIAATMAILTSLYLQGLKKLANSKETA